MEIKETIIGNHEYMRLGICGSQPHKYRLIVDERFFFEELGSQTIEIPKILEDNNGVVLSVNGMGSNPRNTKSIDIKEKHVQDRVQKGEVKVEYVGKQGNIADALTKPLSYVAFEIHFPYL